MAARVLPLSLALARRELRGGFKGFRLFLACLAVGVAAIAAVGSLSAGLEAGLVADARALLGGDVHLRLSQRPATPEQRAWLEARATVSESLEMRAMGRAAASGRRRLVELKAVDRRSPLYGSVVLDPALPLGQALERRQGVFGAVVDANLLSRLDLAVGDRLRIGSADYAVRATIEHEPDRGAAAFTLGPRVMVAAESLASTGLVRRGSLIHYHYRLRLGPSGDHQSWIADLKAAWPEAGWRIRDFTNAAPEIKRFIDRVGLYLTLVGLTALLMGGVGVGNAVKSYLEGKTAIIATLKCLGASGNMIASIYLAQVMIMALGGVALGLVLGALMPVAAAQAVAGLFPFAARIGLYPEPLALAAAYGLLTALAFAVWPLSKARQVSAAGLFRDLVQPAPWRPRLAYAAASAAAAAALAVLAVAATEEKRLALWFVAFAGASLATFTAAAWLLKRAAALMPRPRRAGPRLALANIHRPGAPTGSVLLSLGFGLTVLVTVAAIERNLSHQLQERMPERAPSFYFIDIQTDQAAAFDELVASVPGVSELRRVPSLRGRIVALDGVPVERITAPPEHRWVLTGDRGLTYAASMPPGTTLVEGAWWPADYAGPPLISMDAHIARGFGLAIGDGITLNILGRKVTATIANLRQIDWSTLGINFVLMLAPGTLEGLPQTHIATARVPPESEEALEAAVTDRFANITAIRVREALETVQRLLVRIGQAVHLAAALTMLAGALVLAGAIASSHHRRVYDSVVLKVLGATRADILRAYIMEFAVLGAAAGALAVVAGSIAAWAVVTRMMGAEFQAAPGAALVIATGGVLIAVGLGLIGAWRALGRKAAPVLRGD